MKAKTINQIITKKFKEFLESIDDEFLRVLVEKNTIVTGGCIASMLMKEKINDFDLYFTNKETVAAVANYYVNKFKEIHPGTDIKVEVGDERIRIVTEKGYRGSTTTNQIEQIGTGDIEDIYEDQNDVALEQESKEYLPVFISTNAITLTNKIQLILRFYGDAEEIHQNYDFVHCTNFWTSCDYKLTLRQDALEAILARELRYSGSKYPLCSMMRIRKFIKRGWTVNAGQILKMAMQLNDLDLTDPKVLEDQLTGVDSAYFVQIIEQIKANNPEKINTAYLVEIIDRMF